MLVLFGVNHKSAPLELREKMAFAEPTLGDDLRRMTELPDVDEAMILSTCNRVEILVRADDSRKGLDRVKEFLERERGVSADELQRYTYHYVDRDAARHLFRVASGLDSMVLGEPQILGQVKQAFAAARDAGTVGSILDHLLRNGISAAKRVRTETGISRHAVSIAFAAVELARKIFGDLRGRSALLLGAGKMGALVATHLRNNGVGALTVASRTFNRSAQLAERIGGSACNWDESFTRLTKVDIVVSGTAAPGYVLEKRHVHDAARARRGRPLFLIDIAVPRDVEPAVNDLDNVYLYDVDDLQGVVDDNLEERQRAADEAMQIVEQEVQAFDRWLESLKIAPTIVALREALLSVAQQELERHRRRLGPLSPEQDDQLRQLVRGLIQKILHRPIVHLKGAADRGDAPEVAALYRKIFGIAAGVSESAVDEPPSGGPTRVLEGGKD